MGWVPVNPGQSVQRTDALQGIRIGAKARIVANESMLLVREQHADDSTFWTLPGGGIEPGESPIAGLRREVREELNADIHIGNALDTLWYAHRSGSPKLSMYRVFECDLLSAPRPNPAEGVLECRWTDLDAFPSRTLPQVRYFVHSVTCD